MVEAVGAVLDAFEEFGLVVVGPGDVVGAQGADGGLDGCEGVRRSWLTAASSAVLIRLPSASLRASSASPTRRWRSRTTAAWAAKAPSTRRSSAGSTRPERARAMWSPTGMSTSASSGRATGAGPTLPAARPRVDVALPLQQGDGLHPEGLADPVQERGQGGLAAQHAARPGRRGSRTRRAAWRPDGCGGPRGPRRRPPRRPPRRRSRWRRSSRGPARSGCASVG